MTGRGNDAQIGTYVDLKGMFGSELSGNLIDVCPVGALTSKPYAFQGRPWENRRTETICTLDGVGQNISVSTRAGDLLRVIPVIKDDINEEWISDRTRFSYDGLKKQRLTQPLIRVDGKLVATHWEDALESISNTLAQFTGSQVGAVAGDQADAETLTAMKDFLARAADSDLFYTEEEFCGNTDIRSNYLFNSSIAGIENSDLIILVGVNPRFEATLINARIRKTWIHNETDVAVIGPKGLNLTYSTEELGDAPDTMEKIIKGTHPFAEKLKNAKRPMIIVGSNSQAQGEGKAVLDQVQALAGKYNVEYNYLHNRASTVAALDLGLKSQGVATGLDECQIVFNLGANEGKFKRKDGQFVVFIGTHGEAGAREADVILPAAAYTEKHATFVNTEGRAQQTRPAVHPPGAARVDWQIIRALSETVAEVTGDECTLPYDTLTEVRERIEELSPNVTQYDHLHTKPYIPEETKYSPIKNSFTVGLKNLEDYYMTCAITRSSSVMADCTKSALENDNSAQYIEPMEQSS